MKNVPMMSWNDRFALIDQYKPSNAVICSVFNLNDMELQTANKLREAGTFSPNPHFDTSKFAGIFPDIDDNMDTQPIIQHDPVISNRPETYTKKVIIKEPQKRGRKGSKIVQALFAVPNIPVSAKWFSEEHDISLAVLRQSKRFTEHLSPEDTKKIGKICVKQNKEKILMIWREDL
jgi:hypothetical protein